MLVQLTGQVSLSRKYIKMYVVEVAFWKGKLQSNVELTKQVEK
jgi:hypothetical protein